MVDFLSPGTKVVQRRKGPVVLPGIATAIGGFLCFCEKGQVGEPTLVTGPDDAAEIFGGRITNPGNGRMTDALADFFNQGGASCYVLRYIGDNSDVAARNVSTTGGLLPGTESSDASAFPVQFVDGDDFDGEVDGVAQGTLTIVGKAATATGSGATYAAVTAAHTLVIQVDGIPGNQTITFAGTENSEGTFLATLNAQSRGGSWADNGSGEVKFTTDVKGTDAGGQIVSGSADVLASLGLAAGAFAQVAGSNVADLDTVTAAEFAALASAEFTGTGGKTSTTVDNGDGSVTWTSGSTGASSSVQFTGGTGVSKVSGFDTLQHDGSNNATTPTASFVASSPGTWANLVGIKCVKNDVIVTQVAPTSAGATTSLSVSSTARLTKGDQISITQGLDVQRGVIKVINGTTVTLTAAITVPGGGYDGTEDVVLETFDVTCYNADGTVFFPSPFRNLRMSELAGPTYFVNVINSAARSPITAEDLLAGSGDTRPSTDSAAVLMTGGLDGDTPVAQDVIDQITKWDKASDVSFISIPGINTDFTGANGVAILKAQEAYVERRQDVIAIVDLPKGTAATGGGGAKDYVQNTANLASSYEAVYWPWPKRLDQVSGVVQAFPPSPFVQGIIARTHANRNFGKAPAGIIDGQVLGINDLETKIAENSAEYDDMYPAGVNAILKFGGQGFAIWGSRTLDPTGEFGQLNVQIVFNVNKRLARTKTRFVNFENNDTDTRASLVRVLTATFREQRLAKILAGSKDEEAFYIICDESNNTPLVINKGKLKCRVGLAVNRPSEFLEFEFEQDTRAVDAALAALGA